jgi:cysteine desulfurase
MSGAYLDHAASTPMRPEVLAAMLPYLTTSFANPSGVHAAARAARRAIDDARDELSALLGCAPGEIVFTSGGTEADNLALAGATRARPGSVVVSAFEHEAVLRPAHRIGTKTAPVTSDGFVDLAALDALLDDDVTLVSVMAVNNEVGTVQPLGAIAALVHRRAPTALLHTDAVQGVPWLDVVALAADYDLVSVSGHKFGGPKGTGALVVRRRARRLLAPLLEGGAQESELRAGTENVAGIVGFATAAARLAATREDTVARIAALRDRLVDGLILAVDGARELAPRAQRIAGSAHLVVPGVAAEEVLMLLDDAGVAASAGSACASGAIEPSHVLVAMGCSRAECSGALRFSLGWSTTDAEIDHALDVVPGAVARLRERVH